MAAEIRWTPEATETFKSIIVWLEQQWNEREIAEFIRKTQYTIRHISEYPEMLKASSKRDIRTAKITAQINLFYKIYKSENIIALLSFWENRQNPEKRSSISL